MAPSFTDKTILITGAGSGIGRATAIKLASLGVILLLSDINLKSAIETHTFCMFHAHHNTAAVDVSNSEECNSYIQEMISKGYTINHVFNCAGINPTAMPITEITDEYWDKLINTNLKGTFNITRAITPHLSSGSSIVNVSSVCGIVPVSHYSVYCATKYAVIGFSKCMALELGPRGIRTNVVAPGYINTPTNASVVEGEEAVRRMEGTVAMGRLGLPEEVADVVGFLMSDEARYVNGSVVEVNGGMNH
ncbi:3-oxoacyl-reductase [Sclerotinia borealis F-4128]|uniref:Short-chain dehydrogenase/reductase ABA4 n=1 Tax=Sclerotinia borealis (strain F-4128) TaxID=1432307 RepID=W9CDK1_SCLBF|nr:3-oxoacyl-reductase [Sclerotinia borealis F-4128]